MTTAATPVIALEGIVKRYPVGDGWLTALTDIRLALGAMLGITDEPSKLPPDHPHAAHRARPGRGGTAPA